MDHAETTNRVQPARRRIMQVLLGGGLLASAVAFLYPVLRYLVPPAATDLGGDSVVAAKVGELKANSGKIFRFGQPAGLAGTHRRWRVSRHVRGLYPPELHRAIPQ